MKKFHAIFILSALGGATAFVLRILQNRTGFEASTGLPISGNPAGLILIFLFIGITVAITLLTMRLPKENPSSDFFSAFSTTNPTLLMLPVAGILLLGLSAILDIAAGIGLYEQLVTVISADGTFLTAVGTSADAFSPIARLLLGIMSLLSAGYLFLVVAACRRKEDESSTLNTTALLVPPVVLVVRLVLTYRIYSVNPVLAAYYVELLALVLLTLGFYRLASFACQAGHSRRFCLYAATCVPFCMASAANISNPSAALLYLGGGLFLLGFLLLHLTQIHSNQ